MFKLNIKLVPLLMVFLCLFMTLSCVCASEVNDINNATEIADSPVLAVSADQIDDEKLEANDIETLNEVSSSGGTGNTIPATYNDLRDDLENLNDGDVYDIQKNYIIDDCDSDLSKNRAINIYADNVVINGHSYTIDANNANGYFAVFRIFGNNVQILNLNIVNARALNSQYSSSIWNAYGDNYTRVVSPIEWYGDNGVVKNSNFIDNAGEEGGAIYWAGNNGLITSSDFEYNTASRGGAIFICGNNNTISSCVMQNSYSDNMDIIFIKNLDENLKTLTLNVNKCFVPFKPENVNLYDSEGLCVVMDGNTQIYPDTTVEPEVPVEITEESYMVLREIFFDLKDGDIINLTKDYYFEPGCYLYSVNANNVIINGNGHKIYAKVAFEHELIWVNGNNVTITGIIFELSETVGQNNCSYVHWGGADGILKDCTFTGNYAETGGAVYWAGRNGVIEACTFNGNTAEEKGGAIFWKGINGLVENCYFNENYAENGGAISWTGKNGAMKNNAFVGSYATKGGAVEWSGNNGLICDCVFVNNTAKTSGGAIFIKGKSNRINNTLSWNSVSGSYGQSIFIDYTRKNLTLTDVYFNNKENAVFDEGIIGTHLDAEDILSHYYFRMIGAISYDINSMIYKSIINGGVTNFYDGSYYYSQYYDESGDFVFTLHSGKYVQYDIDYYQSFYFKNINQLSDVFTKLWDNDYETRMTIIETININNYNDYLSALGEFYQPENLMDIMLEDLNRDWDNAINEARTNPLTFGMSLIFKPGVTISGCTIPWDMRIGYFDALSMNGNHAKIEGTFDEDDEYIWLNLGEGDAFSATNLTVAGWNTAVENLGGQCVFNGVTFKSNQMDYLVKRDWGGAILNTGFITCVNCIFEDNYAKNGGAIFNQGLLVLENCSFSNNEAYGEGNDVCVGDGGKVIVNGVEITENGQSSVVYLTESLTLAEATLIAALGGIIGTIAATIVGALTLNPAAGMLVGLAVGAAMGMATAGIIIENTYDVNFDRLTCVLTLSIVGGIAGAAGGLFGGGCAQAFYIKLFIGGMGYMQLSNIIWIFSLVETIPGFVDGIAYATVEGITYYYAK